MLGCEVAMRLRLSFIREPGRMVHHAPVRAVKSGLITVGAVHPCLDTPPGGRAHNVL